jgi:hypothetical protein
VRSSDERIEGSTSAYANRANDVATNGPSDNATIVPNFAGSFGIADADVRFVCPDMAFPIIERNRCTGETTTLLETPPDQTVELMRIESSHRSHRFDFNRRRDCFVCFKTARSRLTSRFFCARHVQPRRPATGR